MLSVATITVTMRMMVIALLTGAGRGGGGESTESHFTPPLPVLLFSELNAVVY